MTEIEVTDKTTLAFTLTSPSTTLILPIHITDVKYMLLRAARYITASSNQKRMIISLGRYNSESYYFDGSTYTQFFRILQLPNTASSHMSYNNTQEQLYDFKLPRTETVTKITADIYIDGSLASDITVSNPLDLEITFIKKLS